MFEDMHCAQLDAFGVSGQVTDPMTGTFQLTVVMARDVEKFDEYGAVVGRVSTMGYNPKEGSPKIKDTLEVCEGDIIGFFTIGKIIEDNGYIATREIIRAMK
jgi:hypothetical protein